MTVTETPTNEGLARWIPAIKWIRSYKREYLPSDFIAGMTVSTMLVPQSMAYALLAGLPPSMGLYASILPVLIYGLLGTSPVLTMGPTAITSVLILSSLQPIADPSDPRFAALAITLALYLGIVLIVLGLFRLGWIVNFLSQPVLVGYINAAAIIIGVSQVQHLTGIDTPNTRAPFLLLFYPLVNITQINLVTFAIGTLALGILLYFRYRLDDQIKPFVKNDILRFYIVRSAPLLVVILTTLISYLLRLEERANIAIIGSIPAGLPPISTLDTFFFSIDTTIPLLIGAGAIAFVGFFEGISTAKTLASQQRQEVNANQELLAMGIANLGSAFSGGFATTTSISRSAVNHAAGAQTGLSSVITAIVMAITVAFLSPAFYYLPRATLAAIIISAIVNLINFSDIRKTWRYSRWETAPFVVTLVGVLTIGIGVGIGMGILIAVALHLWRTSRPYIAELGRIGNTEQYENIKHYDDARLMPNTTIVRMDESLYFANMLYLEDYLRTVIAKYPDSNHLILSFSSVNRIDASALQLLTDLVTEFAELGITIYFAEVKSQLMFRLEYYNFIEIIGKDRFFDTIHEAVRQIADEPDLKIEEYHI